MGDYTTSQRDRGSTTFTLDGEAYTFTFPKTAGLLLDMAASDNGLDRFGAMVDWLDHGLPAEQSQKLLGRLRDPEDALDTEVLGQIIRDLMEEASEGRAGNPTG